MTLKLLIGVVAASMLIGVQATSGQTINQTPSCYPALNIARPAGPPSTALFVMVDQTVLLDDGLKRSLLENAAALVRPNTEFEVIAFSAFSQGRYLKPLAQGATDPLLPPNVRNTIGVKTLAQLDRCIAGQQPYASKLVQDAVAKAAGEASASLARSDIMNSIKDVSSVVSRSQARRKILLIASDMLENSSVSSFYARNKIRSINPAQEIEKAKSSGMIADLGGAEIYVIGAGLMGDSNTPYTATAGTTSYRDPAAMVALKQFWTDYFRLSHSVLTDFGEPALLHPLK